MNKKGYYLVIFISTCLLAYLLKIGLKNKIDPLWEKSTKIANTKTIILGNRKQKIQELFDSIHPNTKINAISLISKPFLPIIRFSEFKKLINKVLTEKKIILTGVGGAGKSTIIDKVALLITGEKSRITKINCIEGLEEYFHKKWIGYSDTEGYTPGELLNLFEECYKKPSKKYVLVIDDFDKIYRTSFFGEALWKELGNNNEINNISESSKEIHIPNNLYIISTTTTGYSSKVPLTASDFRRLSNGTVFNLIPSAYQLKEYLTSKQKKPLTQKQKDSIASKLYFFLKTNEIITKKIGEHAVIGQWTKLNNLLKDDKLKTAEQFVLSNIKNHEKSKDFSEKDFKKINYTIAKKGQLKGTNPLTSFAKKTIDLGVFSEFTVAILFTIISYIRFSRKNNRRKRNLHKTLEEIRNTEQKYLLNKINYNNALGNFLSLKDSVDEMGGNGRLSYTQILFLNEEIKQRTETVDFIQNLGEKSVKLKLFMKIVYADDDITTEEYRERIQFLKENLKEVDPAILKDVKQRLVKLHQKSNLKFGRTKI